MRDVHAFSFVRSVLRPLVASTVRALGVLAALAGAASLTPARAETAGPPNILYIMADDLGWGDVGFHGSQIATKTLDALAKDGVTFDQFYVQPMCTPTRAALMTGRYPMRYGLQSFVILPDQTYGLPTDEKTLPEVLKAAGYETAIIGKWHLGHADRKYWPRSRGFDYQYGSLIGEIDYYNHDVHGVADWFRNDKPLKEKGYATTLFGEDAVRLIKAHDPKKPLFLYLAFNAPHTPFQAPQAYIDRYKDIADPNRRTYAAMVTAMDDQIGAVIKALDEKGMRDNTLIIFQSDNGGVRNTTFAGQIATKGDLPASNGPFRDGKGSLYEGGTRAVAFANWPGHIAPGTVPGLMHVVDMLPTLASVAKAPLAGTKPLDGMDMWPTISAKVPSPRNEVLLNVELFRGAVRQGDKKLIWRAPLPSTVELYDVVADPGEKTNLAEANPAEVEKMRARINALAGESAKSLFFESTFKALVGHHGKPIFPNDPAYFEQAD